MEAAMQIRVGTSPAGVEWIVYQRDRETPEQAEARAAVQRVRLDALQAKAELRRLLASWKLAKQAYYASRTAVARKRTTEAEHCKVSDRLKAARLAYQRAERKAARKPRVETD